MGSRFAIQDAVTDLFETIHLLDRVSDGIQHERDGHADAADRARCSAASIA